MTVTVRLDGSRLTLCTEVENTGKRALHYAFGGHPGFLLPFAGGKPEDYFLRFAKKAAVRRIRFEPTGCFPVAGTDPLDLSGGDTLPFDETFFTEKSLFLCGMPDEVTFAARHTDRRITLSYPGFSYLGLWKAPGAGFLCIEPWSSLPAYNGEKTEFAERRDFLHLPTGETMLHEFHIQIN